MPGSAQARAARPHHRRGPSAGTLLAVGSVPVDGVEGVDFADLGVPAPLCRALTDQGISNPFPIQAASLPDSLAGRDVLGRGRTGSGKTVAFALPTVAALVRSQRPKQAGRPRALILVPTRELANQVAETVRPLAAVNGLRIT